MFETVARIAWQVQNRPEKLAVDDGATSLSYRGFWDAAMAIRQQIDAAAPPANCPVYVCLSRSTDLIVACFAVLVSGRRCIPLDPAHPLSHNAALVRNGGDGVLIAASDICDALSEVAPRSVKLRGLPHADTAGTPAMPGGSVEFQLYTSGSTGVPKGVLIERGAMLRAADAVSDRLGISDRSIVLHFAAPAFDSATFEWILALSKGASLCVVPDQIREDPDLLGQYLVDKAITHAVLPSALLPLLPTNKDYVLEALVVAGDVCPEDTLQNWARHYPTFNGYGPSECTVCASLTRVKVGQPVSIGDVLDGVALRVCDAGGDDANYGEILLGGAQVSLGYHNDDTRAEAFSVDAAGVRWYRTGDWARRDEAGNLIFAGRKDAQLKIRGNRVDLSQLDQIAAGTSDVKQVCSLVRIVANGEKRLCLFASSDAAPKTVSEAIAHRVSDALPSYYALSHIAVLPALPITANDKIDRKALLDLIEDDIVSDDPLSAIFAMQSGAGVPQEADNFFACGGNSIAVLRMLRAVAEEFGVHVPLAAFQKEPTLGHLRALIRMTSETEDAIVAAPAKAQKRYPLTPQQEAIWFLHQTAPDSKAYLAEAAIWFQGAFDSDAMQAALADVFARHEVYRTVFDVAGDKPFQQVLAHVGGDLPLLDRTSTPTASRDAELVDVFAKELPNIADLGARPPARFVLIKFADDLHVMLHQEHHIIHDGWGGNVFTDDLIRSYRARVDPSFAHAPQDVPQYLNFADRQDAFLRSSAATQQLDYWRGQLDNCPDGVTLFGKKSTTMGFKGGVERQVFSQAEWDDTETHCRALGITTFAYCSAVLFLCLARHSGQDDLTIGSAFANRGWANSHYVLGMLVNTIVLRQKMNPDQTLQSYLEEVHETVQAAQANERYPFAKLVEELNPERSGGNPFFNVLLGFHDTPLNADTPEGLTWTKDETVESGTSKFDLDCLVIPRKGRFRSGDEVHFLWEYRSDIYDASEIQLFLENFRHVFLSAFDHLEVPVSEVPALSGRQVIQLQQWGQGAQIERSETTLLAGIAAHAKARPDHPALCENGQDLSYRQMMDQAQALARKFTDAGLTPGGCVALDMHRCNALVVGFLATWLADGTAVVLDPQLPAERRDHLLDLAKPEILLRPDLEVQHIPANVGANCDPARAYIVFTSGSTGMPKGVEVSHDNLRNLCQVHGSLFDLSDQTIGASLAHPAFDAQIAEVWPVLLAGGRVVHLDDDDRNDFGRLEKVLRDCSITHCCLSTGLFEAALGHGVTWPDSLRTLLTGGDRLGPIRRPTAAGFRLFNMYGPTEVTVDATYYEITQCDTDDPPIGRPVPNAIASVVDDQGNQCPAGVEGELMIGGAGLAKGYLAQPELTAERFVVGAGSTRRMYHTGDYARWSLDGQLLFSGRRDDEVKIRGFRVNLNEITRSLMQDPRVAQATAAVKGGQLLGFVVPVAETQRQIELGELKPERFARQLAGALRKSLPNFMRPNAVIALDAFALTAQGKIDRLALPSFDNSPVGYTSPNGPTEAFVAAVWSEFLERDRISATESFFAIGGHSLLAIKIMSRLGAHFGITLKLEDFFDSYTVRDLSRLIDTLVGLAEPQSDAASIVDEGEL